MTSPNKQEGERSGVSPYAVIDPREFLTGGMFRQAEYLNSIAAHDWNRYRDQRVLVRGCGDVPFPPWAYMVIATRLVGIARNVRFGNEHDHVVVYRREKA